MGVFGAPNNQMDRLKKRKKKEGEHQSESIFDFSNDVSKSGGGAVLLVTAYQRTIAIGCPINSIKERFKLSNKRGRKGKKNDGNNSEIEKFVVVSSWMNVCCCSASVENKNWEKGGS